MPSTSTDRIDGLTTSVAIKAPCVVAATSNITLSGVQTVGSVSVVAGDRVLVTAQTSGSDNGIWVCQSTAWTRAKDFNGARDAVKGTIVLVAPGTGDAQMWQLTTSNPVIGTTSLTFTQFSPEELALRADLLDTTSTTKASGMVWHKPNYVAAIAHSLYTHLGAWVSIFTWMSDAQIAAYQASTKPDITTAIANALAAFPTGKATIYFPFGAFKTTSQSTVAQDRMHLVGAGRWATEWEFAPTANATCLKVDKGSTVAYQGSIKGFAWTSSDTTYTKIAVHVVDGSGYEVSDIAIGPSANWTGGTGSIGVRIDGREIGTMRDWYVSGDKPLVIGPIPAPHSASGIGIDHHNFHNLYLIACGLVSADFSPITIETGVLLTQVSFTGFQAWIGGKHGLQWIDTTSTGVSNGLTIDNLRCEQTSNAAGHLIYIEHNQELQGLTIRGGQGGDRNGFHLRKVANVVFDGFCYTGTGEALNADSTVKRIEGRNCFWQTGSTKTLTGQQLVMAVPLNPNSGALPPTFYYDEATNVLEALQLGGSLSITTNAVDATIGNTTFNSVVGRVNMAAGATSLTVANNFVTANSTIFLTPAANDATGANLSVVASSGLFVINAKTAPTANWAINFWLVG